MLSDDEISAAVTDATGETPMVFVVESRAQLLAAVRCAAQPTFAEAKHHPVAIRCGTTIYQFGEGITERRAQELCQNITRTAARAFRVVG